MRQRQSRLCHGMNRGNESSHGGGARHSCGNWESVPSNTRRRELQHTPTSSCARISKSTLTRSLATPRIDAAVRFTLQLKPLGIVLRAATGKVDDGNRCGTDGKLVSEATITHVKEVSRAMNMRCGGVVHLPPAHPKICTRYAVRFRLIRVIFAHLDLPTALESRARINK